MLSPAQVEGFRNFILRFYDTHGRKFSWRQDPDPYRVLISEIMLQQTQTERVEKKIPLFLREFPGIHELAQAPLSQVLNQWVGLGYNRRAKNLHACAKIICEKHNGIIPFQPEVLITLPGIGGYTAGSIPAFAYNLPTTFIETNIRRVFIHHFTLPYLEEDKQDQKINDRDLLPLIQQTLDAQNPRRWYYALMDYGAMLKNLVSNPNRRSSAYGKQSTFSGSMRQIRGSVIRVLVKTNLIREYDLSRYLYRDLKFQVESPIIESVLLDLVAEGFVEYQTIKKSKYICLKK